MVPAQAAHKRVLVVEDDYVLREMLSMLLAGDGYMVSTAANGQEAMQRLRGRGRPDLILLDLMMPVKDGVEFRHEQQEDRDLANIPVVVFSAAADVKEQAASLGAAECLQKPVESAQLL